MLKRTGNEIFWWGLFLVVCLLVPGQAWSKVYNLRATTGLVHTPPSAGYPIGEDIVIWGFADCGTDAACSSNPPATLPGPVLEVPPGESLYVNLKNDLTEPVSFMVAGQSIFPHPDAGIDTYTMVVGPGSSGSYSFTSPTVGTYLYESGTNQSKQVQMGLYGALIVRDYAGVTFDRESVLVLSDIDPAWHVAVAAGQPYNAVYFNPKYWLINGKAYPNTGEILAKTGEKAILRYLNAGSQDHVVVIQGMKQKGIADDGTPTTYPLMTSAVVMNPGQTQDLILEPSTAGVYPLYDRRLDITNWDHFPGGMIAMVRVIDSSLSGVQILSDPVLGNYVNDGITYHYDTVAVDTGNLDGALTYGLVSVWSDVEGYISPPPGMTLDPNTGMFSWALGAGDTGSTYVIVIGATNTAGDTDNQLLILKPNHNPAVDPISNQTVSAGTPITPIHVSATDADGDSLTYSFFDVFTPLSINPSTGEIAGTPHEPLNGSYTYTVQVRVEDGHGGVGSQTFDLTVVSAAAGGGGGGAGGTNAVTFNPIEYGTGNPISDFKFTVNLDNSAMVDPDAVVPCDPCPSHQFESNSPVVAVGTVKGGILMVEDLSVTGPPNNGNGSCDMGEVCVPGSLTLPDGKYLVTILAGTFDPANNIPDDLEMRNGGVYKIDGKHFTVQGADVTVTLEMQPNPLPLSQITVQVFQDNRPTNGFIDPPLELVPMRNGIPDHFQVLVLDPLGKVSTDGFGNPICTQYDAADQPIPGTGGVCLTDDNGFIRIPNVVPNRYEVRVLPPVGSGWIQTTTIEGTKGIDAWVQEGNSGILPEVLGLGGPAYLVFHGFVRPCQFGDPNDDCPTNDVTGAGRITGQVLKLQPARPPFLQLDGPGEPVRYPWIALNREGIGGELMALVRGDENGNFTFTGVPDGFYQAVLWDDPMDYLISFLQVSVPDASGSRDVTLTNPFFGGLVLPDWFGRLTGMVFLDKNENGLQDAGEIGLPDEYVEVRHRDGSLLYSTVTDKTGRYEFREFFPFGHFMIAGIGYTRLGDPGLNVIASAGQNVLPGGSPVETRTDLGPELTMGVMHFEGETNVINWGKKPYPLNGNPDVGNDYVAPNGGISGAVWYATTRNEEDIRFAAADDWEPGIPDLYLDLYERIVDPVTHKTVMDPATGAARKGRYLGRVITDHYNRPGTMPENCSILDNAGNPAVDPGCEELLRTWNQVKPGVWDGAYQFFYDQSDPANPGSLLNCDPPADGGVGVGPGPGQCHPLPAGTYLVELEVPKNYLLVTENDRNVIDAGDTFVHSLRDPVKCVGPLYSVLDPASPDYGKQVAGCGMKEVTVDQYSNAAADFHLFTEVPIPTRLVGLVTDNVNTELRQSNPWFQDKPGLPNIPISIKDYKGKEITRVYTDPSGMFDVLMPSTYRANVPTPSGISPGMVMVYTNDPGTPGHPDPHFNLNYDTLVLPFELWPGKTNFPDIALTPVNGFLANKNLSCGPETGTPQIQGVSFPMASIDSTFTIDGMDFGTDPGRVTLGGAVIPSTNVGWGDTAIDVTIPHTWTPGPYQLLVTGSNGKVSPTGITIHVTGGGYIPHVIVVPSTNPGSIQEAIDDINTHPGDVILIPPGNYLENPILWKPVTLQGFGAGKTVVNGAFTDPITSTVWLDKMHSLIVNGDITILPGQPIDAANAGNPVTMATITVMAKEGAGGSVRIDGLTILGARISGGIHLNSFADNAEISNNTIMNNFGGFGGAMSLGFPDQGGDNKINHPHVHHNFITRNGSFTRAGSIGVFDGVNSYEIDHNAICANYAEEFGAGISHYGTNKGTAPGRIANNDILINNAGQEGGGILLLGHIPANPALPSPGTGPVEIEGNRIQGNFATGDGAGIAIISAGTYPIHVVNNIIVDNITAEQGGGISVVDSSNLTLMNNTIAKNNSTSTAPTLVVSSTDPHSAGLVILPNTPAFQNSLPPGSSTISDPYVFNNIFWDNVAYTWDMTAKSLINRGPFDLEAFLSAETLSHVSNNLFTQVPRSVDGTFAALNKVGEDPQFMSPYDMAITGVLLAGEGGPGPIANVLLLYGPLAPAGDYHLQGASPAIDMGGATFEGGSIAAPSVDYDNDARPINNCFDSGADEAVPANAGPDFMVNVGDPHTFSASASSAGCPLDAANLQFAWDFGDGTTDMTDNPAPTHTYNTHGVYIVTLTVTDPNGVISTDTVTVNVNGVPVITSTPVTSAVTWQTYQYQVTATDPDSDPLTFSLSVAPAWLSIDPGTGLITGSPSDPADVGNHSVTVNVNDGHGGVATQNYTLNVKGDLIFADSFESGNLSSWSSAVGSSRLSVQENGAVTVGTKGLQVNVGSGVAYLVDNHTTEEASYHARFFFDPNGASVGTNVQTLFSGVQGSSEVFRVQLTGNSNTYKLRIQARNDAGTFAATSAWTSISNDVHTLEVAWEASSSGSMSLVIDERGALKTITLSGIPSSLRRVEQVRLGRVAATGTITGTEYFDDFVSKRLSNIGPSQYQLRFGGNVINTAEWTETDPSNFLSQNGMVIWASGATSATREGTLNGLFPIDGDFDTRVDFNLPNWVLPTGTSGHQAVNFIVSTATGAGTTPDSNNRLSIGRKRARGIVGFHGYESVATQSGVSTTQSVSSGRLSGIFRFNRVGTTVNAYYWDVIANSWVLLNTATLPAGPVLLSLEGDIGSGTDVIRMELDTLKVTAGSVTIP